VAEKPVALVDMDGTVADYDTGIRWYMDDIRSPEETGPEVYHGFEEPEPDFYRARVVLIRNQAGWWRNLMPLPDGLQIVRMLEDLGFEIHVLTKGPKTSPNAWTEKVEWCKKHLPEIPVTIASDKGLVFGRVLVDDWPPYVVDWLKFRPRGLVVMPDRPWNQGFEHPNVVRAFVNQNGARCSHLLTNREEVFERLQRAYDRVDGEPL
jgi:5'(3')-deoxyribonucleotidase